jgi:HEAT repeat protein
MCSRCSALVLLVALGVGCADPGPAPPSSAELNSKLQSGDRQAKLEAAAWAKQLGTRAAETAPALIALLKSPDEALRQHAASALGRLGTAACANAVPALTAALKDPDMLVRRAAADSLGEFGPAAASAVPALEELSKTDDPCLPGPTALKRIRP